MGRVPLVLAAVLFGFALPSAAPAQEPAASLSDLQQWVRIGDRVTVTDTAGRKTTGSVAHLKPESLSLVLGDGSRDFPPDAIEKVTRRESDPVGNGALIGASVGAGLFLVAVASSQACDWEGCGGVVLLGTLFYGGLGAGIGVGIDALVPGRELVIYRRPGGRVSVGFTPRLAPRRQGVAVSVGF